MSDSAAYIRDRVRTVPNWPAPGVMFRDITPLLSDPHTFRILIDLLAERYAGRPIDYVAGIDARGFILGSVVAYKLGAGFIPVRKKGKLPFETLAEDYLLEYGSASVEVHSDACKSGDRVLLIDDLIATGGTMQAAARLITRLGATIIEAAAIIDLPELGGSSRLRAEGLEVFAVCEFAGH